MPAILLASGAASALSTCMGKNDIERLRYLKKAVRALLALSQSETNESIKLINVAPVIAEVFEDTGFNTIMDIAVK